MYGKILYYSEIESLVPEGISRQDSAITVQTYIDKWLRDQVVIAEAEKYVADDINIDRLVDDYRSSLLSFTYEKRLIEDRLDTVITEGDYTQMYDVSAVQMPLSEPVLHYEYFKVPAKTKGIDRFLSDWRNGRSQRVSQFFKKHNIQKTTDTTEYIPLSIALQKMPPRMARQKLKMGSTHVVNHENHEHFVKVLSYHDRGDKPPMSYIKETLRKRIINDRKQALLQSIKDNLYQIAIDNNQVKRYPRKNNK